MKIYWLFSVNAIPILRVKGSNESNEMTRWLESQASDERNE